MPQPVDNGKSRDKAAAMETEAKRRQAVGHYNAPQYKDYPVRQKIAELDNGIRPRDKAAAMLGVGARYISDAKRIAQDGANGLFQAATALLDTWYQLRPLRPETGHLARWVGRNARGSGCIGKRTALYLTK